MPCGNLAHSSKDRLAQRDRGRCDPNESQLETNWKPTGNQLGANWKPTEGQLKVD